VLGINGGVAAEMEAVTAVNDLQRFQEIARA